MNKKIIIPLLFALVIGTIASGYITTGENFTKTDWLKIMKHEVTNEKKIINDTYDPLTQMRVDVTFGNTRHINPKYKAAGMSRVKWIVNTNI